VTEKLIIQHHSYYQITCVDKIPYTISNDLTKWNPAYFRRENVGLWYSEKNKELRIPKGYPLVNIEQAFPNHITTEDNTDYNYEKINIGLLNYPRDYIQENSLAFMTGNAPFEFTRKETQLYVDLDTGTGKTFLMIATACYFKTRCVIFIPPVSKIGNQWIDTLDNFTTLTRDEYLYVKGSEMCKDIIKGKYKKVKVFIIPRSTVLSFVRKYDDDWTMLTKLVDAMNVGIKGIDEAHMDFNTIVNIDCFTDVPKTYYMSSSPSRSEKTEKIIYKKVFRNVLKHGKKLKTKEQNHIIPLILNFKSAPSYEWLKKIKTKYGPSLAKYGDYLLAESGARDEFIDAYSFALFYLLKFRRDAGKILVICITVAFATELQRITKEMFPFLSSGLFVGSGKDKNKELDNDIIFSTVKSMGTGSEIKNHQLTINTITYASDVMADQISGRIRKQPGNRKGIYCELVNISHKVALEHYNKREPYLMKKAKDGKVLVHTINDYDLQLLLDFFKKKLKYDSNGNTLTSDGRIYINKRKR
jgi:hypothetical protein